MAERAQRNLAGTGTLRAEFRVAAAEAIPYPTDSFDVVLSKVVLNLSPRKDQAFLEILRVLRPGGRLQLAEIVLKADLPEELAASGEAWPD